jgi:hypothetical protein
MILDKILAILEHVWTRSISDLEVQCAIFPLWINVIKLTWHEDFKKEKTTISLFYTQRTIIHMPQCELYWIIPSNKFCSSVWKGPDVWLSQTMTKVQQYDLQLCEVQVDPSILEWNPDQWVMKKQAVHVLCLQRRHRGQPLVPTSKSDT